MLYFNGQSSKVVLIKYDKNDYEKVLEGASNVSITIPSTFTNISSDVLKGLNGVTITYTGSASGKPWGANQNN